MRFTWSGPDGLKETIELRGVAWVDVWFERFEGEAQDDDTDGLDEVMVKVVDLDLRGRSSLGPVRVTLHPVIMSTGEIEERVNNAPGTLELPPFTPTGSATSFLDIYYQVEVGGQVMFAEQRKRLSGIIFHKPPRTGTSYENSDTTPLLDRDGNSTAFSLGETIYTPDEPWLLYMPIVMHNSSGG